MRSLAALLLAVALAAGAAGCTRSRPTAAGGQAAPSTTAPGSATTAPPATLPSCVRPTPGGGPRVDGFLALADNGKEVCVRPGETIAVYLKGTPAQAWTPIAEDGTVLVPRPNGARKLMLGVTAAFYQATGPGIAHLASTRPPCRSAGPACDHDHRWAVTIIVR